MDAPDALTEAVARAIAADPDFDRRGEIYQEGQRLRAKRSMSVPGIADALARDAKVAEIAKRVRHPDPEWGRPISYVYADGMDDVLDLYPEAGK